MTIWLLFWLPGLDDSGTPPPTPVALPFLVRDGRNQSALPAIVRRGS